MHTSVFSALPLSWTSLLPWMLFKEFWSSAKSPRSWSSPGAKEEGFNEELEEGIKIVTHGEPHFLNEGTRC